ncbi:MAG: gliding motility lipoprotein GldD [Chitinophagales bacterium]|nr:gliding motility lipoprotein GldD [Chitinophagales bacterium]
MARSFVYLYLVVLCAVLAGCGEDDYVPKPRGYYRIDFPKKAYTRFESQDCPYSFEYPIYAKVQRDTTFFGARPDDPCWLNIEIPELSAMIHLSYKEINKENNLEKLMEDAHKLSYKHTIKADYIDETTVNTPQLKGIIYEIGGNSASNIQFYMTDSTRNFVRGALYFNAPPNADSLAPVIKFVKQDMLHMINTLQWR